MAAAARLFNPFRDEEKDKEEAQAKAKQAGKFNFAIQPTDEFQFGAFPDDKIEKDAQHPEFDPFQVAIPEIQTVGSNVSNKSNKSNGSVKVKLTPKLVVRLSTQEEVTSRVKMAFDEFDTTSEVTVEGTVYAQVQCSDAKRNAPFALLIPQMAAYDQSFSIRPNEKYADKRSAAARNVPILVSIPKQDVVAVPIAHYFMQKEVKFMPVLVERKITRNGGRVRIAVQVRSRLDNAGDMKDMTILVAVPEKINGNTVSVVRGNGQWDALKRTIKWKVPDLLRGQSELVTAEADLWQKPAIGEDETPFPVMFRCTSVADPITPLEWKLAQVSGSPSQITVPSLTHSFRLLHRLP